LGTEYLLTQRLPASPRWNRLAQLSEGVRGEWREILTRLGYDLEALPIRGYVARADGKPVAVVWPVADPSAFAKLDAEGRPPEGLVVNECLHAGAPYGLLAAGTRFRLLVAEPAAGSAVAQYLELDAAALSEEHRPLLGLLSPESLGGGGFDGLMREARESGAKLRERIDQAIRQGMLPSLGLELGRWAAANGCDMADDERRGELEAGALTFVCRALFLLYAESAGHLPVSQEAYRPHSFKQIVQDAAAERLDPRSVSLWRAVQLLVEAMRTGNTAWAVPGYNGDLFAHDGFEGGAVLEQASVPDSALGPALVALGIDPETGAGFDFSGLEIGHLGHIYEGLLSLRLSVADRDYRYDPRADRYVVAEPGEAEILAGELLWLTDEGGRKGGGVYYTPEPLVRHLVRRGVVPPFERHLEEVAQIARGDPAAAARKLFEFRVLDPACGSAHWSRRLPGQCRSVRTRPAASGRAPEQVGAEKPEPGSGDQGGRGGAVQEQAERDRDHEQQCGQAPDAEESEKCRCSPGRARDDQRRSSDRLELAPARWKLGERKLEFAGAACGKRDLEALRELLDREAPLQVVAA
jgi:hypothetical protein